MATDVEELLDVRTDVGSCQTAVAVELDEEVVLLAAVHDRADEQDVAAATDALERRLEQIVQDEADESQQPVAADGGATDR